MSKIKVILPNEMIINIIQFIPRRINPTSLMIKKYFLDYGWSCYPVIKNGYIINVERKWEKKSDYKCL